MATPSIFGLLVTNYCGMSVNLVRLLGVSSQASGTTHAPDNTLRRYQPESRVISHLAIFSQNFHGSVLYWAAK